LHQRFNVETNTNTNTNSSVNNNINLKDVKPTTMDFKKMIELSKQNRERINVGEKGVKNISNDEIIKHLENNHHEDNNYSTNYQN